MRQDVTADDFQTVQIKVMQPINIPWHGNDKALAAKAGDTILMVDGTYYGTEAKRSSARKRWRRLNLNEEFVKLNTPTFFTEGV